MQKRSLAHRSALRDPGLRVVNHACVPVGRFRCSFLEAFDAKMTNHDQPWSLDRLLSTESLASSIFTASNYTLVETSRRAFRLAHRGTTNVNASSHEGDRATSSNITPAQICARAPYTLRRNSFRGHPSSDTTDRNTWRLHVWGCGDRPCSERGTAA